MGVNRWTLTRIGEEPRWTETSRRGRGCDYMADQILARTRPALVEACLGSILEVLARDVEWDSETIEDVAACVEGILGASLVRPTVPEE